MASFCNCHLHVGFALLLRLSSAAAMLQGNLGEAPYAKVMRSEMPRIEWVSEDGANVASEGRIVGLPDTPGSSLQMEESQEDSQDPNATAGNTTLAAAGSATNGTTARAGNGTASNATAGNASNATAGNASNATATTVNGTLPPPANATVPANATAAANATPVAGAATTTTTTTTVTTTTTTTTTTPLQYDGSNVGRSISKTQDKTTSSHSATSHESHSSTKFSHHINNQTNTTSKTDIVSLENLVPSERWADYLRNATGNATVLHGNSTTDTNNNQTIHTHTEGPADDGPSFEPTRNNDNDDGGGSASDDEPLVTDKSHFKRVAHHHQGSTSSSSSTDFGTSSSNATNTSTVVDGR